MNFVKLLKSGASELVILREGKIFEKSKSYPNLKPKVKINIDNRPLSSSPANLLLMNDPICAPTTDPKAKIKTRYRSIVLLEIACSKVTIIITKIMANNDVPGTSFAGIPIT